MVPRPFCRALSAAPFLPRPFCRALSAAPFLPRLIVSLSLLMAALPPALADAPATSPVSSVAASPAWPSSWDSATHGAFVTALCADHSGDVYAATEDNGVARWDGHAWTQFTQQSTGGGLADDDCYALAMDARGRLFVGTRHGLSVYNGRDWRAYGPLAGLGGWRVFALAVSPRDGDVWAATEGGLTRYSLHKGTWSQYARLDGLPSDACSCLAFAKDGTLYAGTQADGIAISSPATGYRAWRTVPGPAVPPPSPGGDGLPSALINALLVSKSGMVYAATDDGLARSPDGGQSWRFLRGADWRARVQGQWRGPAPVDADTGGRLLAEDYVTALAEDGAGHLFLGHRQKGVGVYSERTTLGVTPSGAYGGYADALLSEGEGRVLVGSYGDGLGVVSLPDAPHPVYPGNVAARAASLPAPAAPPTLSQLNAMLRAVSVVPPDPQEFRPHAVALDQDWATRGDWLGRYGRYWADLCAFFHPIPLDYLWGAGWEPVDYALTQGPQHDPGDGLRYWLDRRYTADPRAPEIPPTYLHSRVLDGYTTWAVGRRDTTVDDHGEAYDRYRSGLNVYATVTVPPGLYTLSLYEMNKDGQSWDNRFRDYRLSVRPHVGAGMQDVTRFADAPEWAHGRVSQFWGGVWERFLVRGPETLTVEVGRNGSLNTILHAVTLDLADETPPPYFGTVADWQRSQAQGAALRRAALARHSPVPFHPAKIEAQAAGRLLDALDGLQDTNSRWWGANGHRFFLPLARWYAAQAVRSGAQTSPALWRRLGTCEYQSGLYPQWEDCLRRAGLTPARDVERSLRWDRVTQSNSGREYQVLTQYLQAQGQRAGRGVKNAQLSERP